MLMDFGRKKLPSERAELESHPKSYYLHKYTSVLRNSNDSRYSRINEITLKLEHSDVVLSMSKRHWWAPGPGLRSEDEARN